MIPIDRSHTQFYHFSLLFSINHYEAVNWHSTRLSRCHPRDPRASRSRQKKMRSFLLSSRAGRGWPRRTDERETAYTMDDSVPDTPVRDRKNFPGTPTDEAEYETIATMPIGAAAFTPSQRLTQPTQLIDGPYSRPPHVPIQVAASSPTGPLSSPLSASPRAAFYPPSSPLLAPTFVLLLP